MNRTYSAMKLLPSITPERACTRCHGTGLNKWRDGATCWACNGARQFPVPDWRELLAAPYTKRGKRRFRASPPFTWHARRESRSNARGYAIWRLMAFYAGIDSRIPCEAESCLAGDPYLREIEALAERLAQPIKRRTLWGESLGGADRWAYAITGDARFLRC